MGKLLGYCAECGCVVLDVDEIYGDSGIFVCCMCETEHSLDELLEDVPG